MCFKIREIVAKNLVEYFRKSTVYSYKSKCSLSKCKICSGACCGQRYLVVFVYILLVCL